MAQFKVNDQVTVQSDDHPGTWHVKKVNPTTYILGQEGRRDLRIPHWVACDPDAAQPARPDLPCGCLVRWTSPKSNGGLYVVLADKLSKVSIAVLGGDGGRYWTVSPYSLTAVEVPADLAS